MTDQRDIEDGGEDNITPPRRQTRGVEVSDGYEPPPPIYAPPPELTGRELMRTGDKQLDLLLPISPVYVKQVDASLDDAVEVLREGAYVHSLGDENSQVSFKLPNMTFIDKATGRSTTLDVTVNFVPDGMCINEDTLLSYADHFRNRVATPEMVAFAFKRHVIEAMRPLKGKITMARRVGRVGGKWTESWDFTKDHDED